MKKYITLTFLLGLSLSSVSSAAPIFDQAFDGSNQIIGAWASNGGADDFSVSSDTSFNNITFWGSYWYNGRVVSDNFNLSIGTSLGASDVYSFSGNSTSFTDTGFTHNRNNRANIYEFSFDLASEVNILANTNYFLTIESIQEVGEDTFVWERSSNTGGQLWIGNRYNNRLSRISNRGDFAFELNSNDVAQVSEPGTFALLGLGLIGLGYARKKTA